MSEPLISRVYSIAISGYDDSFQKLNALIEAFKKLDATKTKLNGQLQQKIDAGDQASIAKLTQQIKNLEDEMAKLASQRNASAKETEALSRAEKNTAQTLLLTEKATVQTAKAEKIRAQTVSIQNKDRQLQLDLEERQRATLDREKQSVDALEGSYLLLKQRRQELENLTGSANQSSTISFEGKTLNFDQAISQIKEMKVEELAFTEQLRIEKTVHDNINESQQQEIISLQKQRVELETLVAESAKTSTLNFGGQSFTNDQALSRITELRSQEQLLTDQLNNEKSLRQSINQAEEQKLNTIRQEIIELEKLISNSTQTSSITFGGQSLNFSQAISQLQQLKTEEQDFTQKLSIEKNVHDQITQSQLNSISALRQERSELETLVASSRNTSKINFQGENISITDSLTKIQQLKTAEEDLIKTNVSQQESSDVVARAQTRLATAQSDTGKQVAELNVQTQLANKANKEIALNTLGLIDEYGRLKIEYNEAAAAAKNLSAISLKTGSTEDIQAAEAATAKAKALHDSLFQIESGVGQAQRNVGNYTGALKILETSLAEAKQKLDSMTQSERDNTAAGQTLQKEVSLLSTLAGQQSQGFTSLRREVLNATQALATLEEQGLAGTPAFEKLQIEVANARRGLTEFNLQQKLLSSEVPGIAALTSVAKGLGAAYAFGAGATALFGDGSEKTAEKLNKLVAVMTILQGLTELNRTLQERSAIATALVGLKEQGLTAILTLKNFVLTGSLATIKADTVAKEVNAVATEGLSAANRVATASAIALRTVLIASGFGALLVLLASAAFGMKSFASAADDAREKMTVLNEVNSKAVDGYVEQKVKLEDMVIALNSTNTSLEFKKEKLKELIALSPEYLNSLTLENIKTQEGKDILDKYIGSLQRKAELESSQAVQTDATKTVATLNVTKALLESRLKLKTGFNDLTKAEQEFFDQSTSAGRTAFTSSVFNLTLSKSDIRQAIENVQEEIDKGQKKVVAANEVFKDKLANTFNDLPATLSREGAKKQKLTETQLKSIIDGIDEERSTLKEGDAKLAVLEKDRDEFQKRLDDLNNKKEKVKADVKPRGSRLDLDETEAIKRIETIRATQLALENKSVNEIEIVRQLSFDEERQHLVNVEKINIDALNSKIALLNLKKKLNAEEAKDRALFSEQITSIELETSQKIEAINKKQFDQESNTLKKQFETQKSMIDIGVSFVLVDRTVSGEDKAIAKKNADAKLLAETINYYDRLKELAVKDKQSAVNIEEEKQKAVTDRIRAAMGDDLAIFEAGLKDADEASSKLINEAKQRAAERATGVLEDNSLSALEKARKLKQIELDEQKLFLAQQEAADRIALAKKEDALKKGLATEGEVAAARAKLAQSTLEFSKFVSDNELGYLAKLRDGLKNALNNITDFFKGVKKSKDEVKADLDIALQATASIIKNAINSAEQAFFQNQSAQVDAERDVAKQRLTIQEQQAINLAQSQAEKDSINRQYAAKAVEVDRKASEEKKKIALKQITIDFGVAVVKTLAAYPFPFSLIPIAGLTIAYLLQRANVEKQQFARGGKVLPEQIANGRITARPNIATQSNGDNVLATVRVGEVILNEEQQRKLGGARTFREIGVPGFASGGQVSTRDRTMRVLSDKTMSSADKSKTIHSIEFDETLKLLTQNREVARLTLKRGQEDRATHLQISDAKTKLKYAELALSKQIASEQNKFLYNLKNGFTDLFSAPGKKATILKNNISELVKNTITDTKNLFFQKKSNEANRRSETSLAVLKEQYINAAAGQSVAHRYVTRREFTRLRDEKYKSAIAEQKKIVIEELSINFNSDLLATKAKYPGPLSVIPVSRIRKNYNSVVNSITKNQYASGGLVHPVKLSHGLINVPANIAEHSDGDNILAFVRRKEVILNEEQQYKAGGPAFFRAIGVPGFASGGKPFDQKEYIKKIKSFAAGGFTGLDTRASDNLLPPINPSSFLNPGSTTAARNEEQLTRLMQMVAATNAAVSETSRQTNQRIDKIKVQVMTQEITKSQTQIKKASAIGTL